MRMINTKFHCKVFLTIELEVSIVDSDAIVYCAKCDEILATQFYRASYWEKANLALSIETA
jgi:hypothetical protein